MYKYRAYGVRIVSDIDFSQLVVDTNPDEDVFEITVVEGVVPECIKNRDNQKLMYDFGDELSWLENRTLWIVMENGNKITYETKPGANPMYVRSYILGWGIAMVGLQRNVLAMHCSIVADEDGAILIAGESGSGKSTLTASFLDKGYRLMADDMSYVEPHNNERTIVYPAFPYTKLCRNVALEKGYILDELIYIDEDKDKFFVPYRGAFPMHGMPIKGFIMLGFSKTDEVVIEEIDGFQKFQIFANNLFLRHLLGDRKFNPNIGKLCLEMATTVPVAIIGRANEGDSTKEVAAKAFEIVKKWN